MGTGLIHNSREIRNQQIKLLYYKGRSIPELAAQFNLTPSAIGSLLTKLIHRDTLVTSKLAQTELTRQLAITDNLISEAYQQWEKSCRNRGKRTRKVSSGKEGKRIDSNEDITVEEMDGLGDPRILSELRALLDRRMKLLGLDNEDTRDAVLRQININVSTAVAVQTNDTQPVQFNPEQMGEMLAIMQRIGVDASGMPIKQIETVAGGKVEEGGRSKFRDVVIGGTPTEG